MNLEFFNAQTALTQTETEKLQKKKLPLGYYMRE